MIPQALQKVEKTIALIHLWLRHAENIVSATSPPSGCPASAFCLQKELPDPGQA